MRRHILEIETIVRVADNDEEEIGLLTVKRRVAVDVLSSKVDDIVDAMTEEQSSDISRYAKTVLENRASEVRQRSFR